MGIIESKRESFFDMGYGSPHHRLVNEYTYRFEHDIILESIRSSDDNYKKNTIDMLLNDFKKTLELYLDYDEPIENVTNDIPDNNYDQTTDPNEAETEEIIDDIIL